MSLLEALRQDATTLLEQNVPTANELAPLLGALVAHVEQLVSGPKDTVGSPEPAPGVVEQPSDAQAQADAQASLAAAAHAKQLQDAEQALADAQARVAALQAGS